MPDRNPQPPPGSAKFIVNYALDVMAVRFRIEEDG